CIDLLADDLAFLGPVWRRRRRVRTKSKKVRPNLQRIAFRQGRAFFDASAVEKGAVAAAEVFDEIPIVETKKLGVLPAHSRRFKPDRGIGLPTNDHGAAFHGVVPAGIRTAQGNKAGHASVLPQNKGPR